MAAASSDSSSLSYISSDDLEEGSRILSAPVSDGKGFYGGRSRRPVVSPASTPTNETRLPERINKRHQAVEVGDVAAIDDDDDGNICDDGASQATSPVRPRSRSPALKSRSPSSTSISSDSSGDIPDSLIALHIRNGTDDVYDGLSYDQVTKCQWEGCDDHDCGNMDELVRHIDQKHIDAGKHKKWICRWRGCVRGGHTHASGSALKAHMRRHTKEKPFMCILPECDRTFTRHDALMKHMRTVHRGEALKPFESQPMQGQRLPRIRFTLGQGQGHFEPEDDGGDENPSRQSDNQASVNLSRDSSPDASQVAELGFHPGEMDLPMNTLCRLLRRQVHWAEKDREDLERRGSIIERMRKETWIEKELILRDIFLMEEHLANSKRREESRSNDS